MPPAVALVAYATISRVFQTRTFGMRLLSAMPPPPTDAVVEEEQEEEGEGEEQGSWDRVGAPRGREETGKRRGGMRRRRQWSRLRPFSYAASSAIAALCLVGEVSATCEYSTLLVTEAGSPSSHEVAAVVSPSALVPPSDAQCPQGETHRSLPGGGHQRKERRTSERCRAV